MTQTMATPNYILPPGVTVPRSLVTVFAPHSTPTLVDSSLMIPNRSVHDVLPVCFTHFHDEQVRQLTNLIIPALLDGEYSMGRSQHMKTLANVGSCGSYTQLELQAVSDCYIRCI